MQPFAGGPADSIRTHQEPPRISRRVGLCVVTLVATRAWLQREQRSSLAPSASESAANNRRDLRLPCPSAPPQRCAGGPKAAQEDRLRQAGRRADLRGQVRQPAPPSLSIQRPPHRAQRVASPVPTPARPRRATPPPQGRLRVLRHRQRREDKRRRHQPAAAPLGTPFAPPGPPPAPHLPRAHPPSPLRPHALAGGGRHGGPDPPRDPHAGQRPVRGLARLFPLPPPPGAKRGRAPAAVAACTLSHRLRVASLVPPPRADGPSPHRAAPQAKASSHYLAPLRRAFESYDTDADGAPAAFPPDFPLRLPPYHPPPRHRPSTHFMHHACITRAGFLDAYDIQNALLFLDEECSLEEVQEYLVRFPGVEARPPAAQLRRAVSLRWRGAPRPSPPETPRKRQETLTKRPPKRETPPQDLVGAVEGRIGFEQFLQLFGEDSGGGDMRPVASSSQARRRGWEVERAAPAQGPLSGIRA